MWKSVGSPHRAWVFVTSTGMPRAAHTLLKFTPAAMTIDERVARPELRDVDHLVLDRVAGRHSVRARTSCACIRGGTSPIGGSAPMS